MIGWAALIVVLLDRSRRCRPSLGLVMTLPVLGHATWHLYRRIMAPVAGFVLCRRVGKAKRAHRSRQRF